MNLANEKDLFKKQTLQIYCSKGTLLLNVQLLSRVNYSNSVENDAEYQTCSLEHQTNTMDCYQMTVSFSRQA